MQKTSQEHAKHHLVLVGGGHSHALVLKAWMMAPIPEVRVTLISDVTMTPYSGMLPGYIGGFYDYDEIHIDLRRLSTAAGVRFVRCGVNAIDPAAQKVFFADSDRPPLSYDVLSINTGCRPHIPSSCTGALGVKPVDRFVDRIEAPSFHGLERKLVIVGGGAGGIESALNFRTKLGESADISVIHDGPEILPTHNSRVRKFFADLCETRRIQLHLEESVLSTIEGSATTSKRSLAFDDCFWMTSARAPRLLAEAGLETDEHGFALVRDSLQATGWDNVFVVGDSATMVNHPRPKSGVFAVRQAKPLWTNLRRFFASKPLLSYKPQKSFLSLIGTGMGTAVASKGSFFTQGKWVWKWKDRIDRAFMERFDFGDQVSTEMKMRCVGCGGKAPGLALNQALGRDVRADAEDAVKWQDHFHTIDGISPVTTDVFEFGQISFRHAANDQLAMGLRPDAFSMFLQAEEGSSKLVASDVEQFCSGVKSVSAEAKLLNAHTMIGETALTCFHVVSETRGHEISKSGVRPGDRILLTKPIGAGVLLAAQGQNIARGADLDEMYRWMKCDQMAAAEILRTRASAMTDVTGFGLLGHLREMVAGEDLAVMLFWSSLPILSGAVDLLEKGVESSLQGDNEAYAEYHPGKRAYKLLCDPQTSGPLLATIPSSIDIEEVLSGLRDLGFLAAGVVGEIDHREPGTGSWVRVVDEVV